MIGATTCAAGIVLIMRHLHMWRQKTDATKDEKQQRFLLSQLRRRVLTSAAISLLGVVIALLQWPRNPTSFTILVCSALVLTFMIFVLASLDFLAVSQAMRLEEQKTGNAAQQLVQEYHRLKKKSAESKKDKSGNESDGHL